VADDDDRQRFTGKPARDTGGESVGAPAQLGVREGPVLAAVRDTARNTTADGVDAFENVHRESRVRLARSPSVQRAVVEAIERVVIVGPSLGREVRSDAAEKRSIFVLVLEVDERHSAALRELP